MLTDLIRPGEKIDIQAVERAILGASSGKKVYKSKVYDVIDEEQLEILMPMQGSKLILLPVDGEYEFCFYTKSGLYQCFVRIVDRYKNNNVYILLCEMISPLRKHQRREYYRYTTILPLQIRELLQEEEKAMGENQFRMMQGLPMQKANIVDISGGGIRFVSNEKYEIDQKLCISFRLPLSTGEQTYPLVGIVLNINENELRRGEYEYRIKFIYIDNTQREEIIRYIFEEERKNRKRL